MKACPTGRSVCAAGIGCSVIARVVAEAGTRIGTDRCDLDIVVEALKVEAQRLERARGNRRKADFDSNHATVGNGKHVADIFAKIGTGKLLRSLTVFEAVDLSLEHDTPAGFDRPNIGQHGIAGEFIAKAGQIGADDHMVGKRCVAGKPYRQVGGAVPLTQNAKFPGRDDFHVYDGGVRNGDAIDGLTEFQDALSANGHIEIAARRTRTVLHRQKGNEKSEYQGNSRASRRRSAAPASPLPYLSCLLVHLPSRCALSAAPLQWSGWRPNRS